MESGSKEGYKLSKEIYHEVLASLKKKDKGMFKLLNKASDKYKEAVYWYMWRIFRDKEIPEVFHMTWLIAIWKKKGSA